MRTRSLLPLVLFLYCPGVLPSPGAFISGPWGPYNFNTPVTGKSFKDGCEVINSGVDDNKDNELTEDEVIVTVVICGNDAPIIRTKGK